MPMSAIAGLANRDAALSAIGQAPIHFKNVQPNLNNPEIKRWIAQHAAGEPITGFGATGSFVPPSLSTSTARLNPQFFGPIPGRVQAPVTPAASVITPAPKSDTPAQQTGSSAAGHGTSAGYTPKKKKKVASTRGTANLRSALLSTSGGSAELG